MSVLAIVFPCSLHVYATYHGVLSHKDHTLGAHGVTDLVHLLRRDIVDTDDEDAVVLLEERLQLVEVLRLGCRFATHSVLRYRNSLRLVLVLLVRVGGERSDPRRRRKTQVAIVGFAAISVGVPEPPLSGKSGSPGLALKNMSKVVRSTRFIITCSRYAKIMAVALHSVSTSGSICVM